MLVKPHTVGASHTDFFFFLILIVELEFSSLNKGELKASLGLLETQSHPLSNHRGKVGGIKESTVNGTVQCHWT